MAASRSSNFALLALILALFGLLVCLRFVGCSKDDEETVQPELPPQQGLTGAELDEYHHLSVGSELFPLSWLQLLESADTGEPFLDNPERFGMLSDETNADGLPIGLSAAESQVSSEFGEMVGFTCSLCHVAELVHDGQSVRIEGAPSLVEIDAFIGDLANSVAATVKDPAELYGFVRRLRGKQPNAVSGRVERIIDRVSEFDLLEDDDEEEGPRLFGQLRELIDREKEKRDISLRELIENPNAGDDDEEPSRLEVVNRIKRIIRLLKARKAFIAKMKQISSDADTVPGPGRADTWVTGRNGLFDPDQAIDATSPSSFPHIWGYRDATWLTWTGCTKSGPQRDVVTALGMGAFFDPDEHDSTVSAAGIYRIDELMEKVTKPVWPEDKFGAIDKEQAARGKLLYKAHCATCHDVRQGYDYLEIGTDKQLAENFSTPVDGVPFHEAFSAEVEKFKQDAFDHDGLTPEQKKHFEEHRPDEWRDEKEYVAWTLDGAWATAPYLHNGSVPTLYHLLLPPAQRPAIFPVGHRDYDIEKLGFTTDVDGEPRFTFDTRITGNSNAGHDYGTSLTEEQRFDLLEFLKTQ